MSTSAGISPSQRTPWSGNVNGIQVPQRDGQSVAQKADHYPFARRSQFPQDCFLKSNPSIVPNFPKYVALDDSLAIFILFHFKWQDRYRYWVVDFDSSTVPFGDIATSAEFQLLATEWAYSLAHLDRHGQMTTAKREEGKKTWIIWPELDDKQARECTSRPVALPLNTSDLLTVPAGRVHCVYSTTDVLATGSMH